MAASDNAYGDKAPGVYRQEVFLKPEARLPTGVPAFVGVADAGASDPAPAGVAVALHRREDFALRFKSAAGSFLAEAVAGFFANGGARCYVVRVAPPGDREAALRGAFAALNTLEDLDLVAVPDAMTLYGAGAAPEVAAVERVQREALKHCAARGDRFALLDPLPGRTTQTVLEQRRRLTLSLAEPVGGALYYPWLRTSEGRLVPPSGHVAGVYARTDAQAGVHKAPANAELSGVLDLETDVGAAAQEWLNREGVNCLRAFRGRGVRVWGARTLSRDPAWRYVNVRRLALTLRRRIEAAMTWASFEPNVPSLWVRVQRELSGHLLQLWRAGALRGATPEQAFFVKCDAETNPPAERDAGRVVCEVGVAAEAPAEFIVLRIVRHADATTVR
ncbi:MAG TPA: phage tail sheath subtilisin-like domain-containing protein [Pyrinomonadaceae bacterium]|jgi:hypothetical protein